MTTFNSWMQCKTRKFASSEAGAVTVDWVVLTAALCGLILTLFTILTQTLYEDAATGISERITEAGEVYR